jgi:hypothetical protein
MYISDDAGQTWATPIEAPEEAYWRSIACSADGMHLVALVGGFFNAVYTSGDGGLTWSAQPDAPQASWRAVAASSDGLSLAAVSEASFSPGQVYLSGDGGSTWVVQESAPAASWTAVASSADGNRRLALENGNEAGGLIYTYGGAVTTPLLVPGQTYHYRLVASNAAGTTLGEDLSFTVPVNNRVLVVPQQTAVVPGGGFLLSFTGDSGLSFTVMMSSDAGLAPEQWVNLGQPVEYPPGTYQFLDEEAGDGERFYRVIAQ